MYRITPLDPGNFNEIPPAHDGCHAAWATSFKLAHRVFQLVFEASSVAGDDYQPFCKEQKFDCSEMFVVKFDNAYNANPEDTFRRMPPEHRLHAHEMIRLSRYLAGGIARFRKELDPSVIVGIPNDAQLAAWYTRLAVRFDIAGGLIGMRESAYHPHRILVIHKA